jgi:formylglycine-generating enzyme required for sulfatase activity
VFASLRSSSVAFAGSRYTLGPPESPAEVEVGPFAIARVPVTNAQFVTFLNGGLENESDGAYLWLNDVNVNLPIAAEGDRYGVKAGFHDHPVVGVTWYGAALFCLAAGGRLPTEAEWEVAGRAGGPGPYSWGAEAPGPERANYAQQVGQTTEVDAYPPNPAGLLDMGGNVRQWCADWYVPDESFPTERGVELPPAARVMRVVRGGAWNKSAVHMLLYNRRGKWPRMGSDSCGFRVAFDGPSAANRAARAAR